MLENFTTLHSIKTINADTIEVGGVRYVKTAYQPDIADEMIFAVASGTLFKTGDEPTFTDFGKDDLLLISAQACIRHAIRTACDRAKCPTGASISWTVGWNQCLKAIRAQVRD